MNGWGVAMSLMRRVRDIQAEAVEVLHHSLSTETDFRIDPLQGSAKIGEKTGRIIIVLVE